MVFVEIKDKVRLIHLILTGLSEWSRRRTDGRTEEDGGIAFPELRPASGWTQLKKLSTRRSFIRQRFGKHESFQPLPKGVRVPIKAEVNRQRGDCKILGTG